MATMPLVNVPLLFQSECFKQPLGKVKHLAAFLITGSKFSRVILIIENNLTVVFKI